MRFIPLSIRRLGLRVYLDNSTANHNGFDYQDFVAMYEAKVNPTNLARAFNLKARNTILHWIKVYKEELKKEDTKPLV